MYTPPPLFCPPPSSPFSYPYFSLPLSLSPTHKAPARTPPDTEIHTKKLLKPEFQNEKTYHPRHLKAKIPRNITSKTRQQTTFPYPPPSPSAPTHSQHTERREVSDWQAFHQRIKRIKTFYGRWGGSRGGRGGGKDERKKKRNGKKGKAKKEREKGRESDEDQWRIVIWTFLLDLP